MELNNNQIQVNPNNNSKYNNAGELIENNVNNNKNSQVKEVKEVKEKDEKQKDEKKKNRTLQYYKFLFYSIKGEIKFFEFFNLISWNNHLELFLWVIGMIFFIINKSRSSFAILNTLHAIRGVIGYCIVTNMPKSYEVLDGMDISSQEMENENFGTIMRKQFKKLFFDKVKQYQTLIVIYLILGFINIFIDIIDFIVALINLENEEEPARVLAYSRLIISLLYISKIIYKLK
jgi:hypothetical protein